MGEVEVLPSSFLCSAAMSEVPIGSAKIYICESQGSNRPILWQLYWLAQICGYSLSWKCYGVSLKS